MNKAIAEWAIDSPTKHSSLLKEIQNLSDADWFSLLPHCPPVSLLYLEDDALVEPEVASYELKIATTTLSVWRCTGREHLPYVKIGRLVRYRVGDLREFKRSRIVDTRPGDPVSS
tara:strand:- start:2403 stop:2747 length:345 start_codon:yes stop_codon:yes gene_type:complete